MVGEENKGYMKKRKESLKGGRNGFRRILGFKFFFSHPRYDCGYPFPFLKLLTSTCLDY